jgi:hypothetical protein
VFPGIYLTKYILVTHGEKDKTSKMKKMFVESLNVIREKKETDTDDKKKQRNKGNKGNFVLFNISTWHIHIYKASCDLNKKGTSKESGTIEQYCLMRNDAV